MQCPKTFWELKTELLYSESFETAEEFILLVKEYIDYYKNKKQVKCKEPGRMPSSRTKNLILLIRPTFWGHITFFNNCILKEVDTYL